MCDICVMNSVKERMLSRRNFFKGAAAAAYPISFLPYTHNQILHAVNLGSLPAWFSLLVLPRWHMTKKITAAVATWNR